MSSVARPASRPGQVADFPTSTAPPAVLRAPQGSRERKPPAQASPRFPGRGSACPRLILHAPAVALVQDSRLDTPPGPDRRPHPLRAQRELRASFSSADRLLSIGYMQPEIALRCRRKLHATDRCSGASCSTASERCAHTGASGSGLVVPRYAVALAGATPGTTRQSVAVRGCCASAEHPGICDDLRGSADGQDDAASSGLGSDPFRDGGASKLAPRCRAFTGVESRIPLGHVQSPLGTDELLPYHRLERTEPGYPGSRHPHGLHPQRRPVRTVLGHSTGSGAPERTASASHPGEA